MPVDTVMPDTFESCLDAMICGNDCDFLNGLYSLDAIDIMHLVFSFRLSFSSTQLLLFLYYNILLNSSTPTSPCVCVGVFVQVQVHNVRRFIEIPFFVFFFSSYSLGCFVRRRHRSR